MDLSSPSQDKACLVYLLRRLNAASSTDSDLYHNECDLLRTSSQRERFLDCPVNVCDDFHWMGIAPKGRQQSQYDEQVIVAGIGILYRCMVAGSPKERRPLFSDHR